MKKEETLSGLIPNVHEWHKQFTIEELKATHTALKHTLSKMGIDLESRKKKLKFEIDWVESHKKHPTWTVAKSAYQKELKHIEDAIKRQIIASDVTEALSLAKTSKSAALKSIADDMRKFLANPNFNIREGRIKADELIKKQAQIEAQRAKRKKATANDATAFKSETLQELSLRLGDNLPKTLPNLDKAIQKYEKSDLYGSVAKEYKANIEHLMKRIFEYHDFGMNIEEPIIEKVLTTYFKNTFEVGSSGGYLGSTKTVGKIEPDHERLIAAHTLFGLSRNLGRFVKIQT